MFPISFITSPLLSLNMFTKDKTFFEKLYEKFHLMHWASCGFRGQSNAAVTGERL